MRAFENSLFPSVTVRTFLIDMMKKVVGRGGGRANQNEK